MARNSREVLAGDRAAFPAAARAHALQFSWKRSMKIVFDEVYPRALARARSIAQAEAVQDGFTATVEPV
jgi:hypothetical protein